MHIHATVKGLRNVSVKGRGIFSTMWPILSPFLECESSQMQMNMCGGAQIKLYLQKQASLLALDLVNNKIQIH